MDSKDTNISIGGLARPLARGARDESQERLSSLVRATPPAISRVARAYALGLLSRAAPASWGLGPTLVHGVNHKDGG